MTVRFLMHLYALSELLSELEPVRALDVGSRATRVFGLLNAAKPAVAAAIGQRREGPLLVVTTHPQTAHDLAEDLQHWSLRPVMLFPAMESLPYERVHLDRELLAQRDAAVRALGDDSRSIVVTSARALLQPVGGAGKRQNPIRLRVGERVQVERLLENWMQMGYSPTANVEESGTFARRGGVVDIFPLGASGPRRIELFGNDIESLRSFDPMTQRSSGPVEELVVEAMTSLGHEARLAALERLLDIDISTLTAEAETAWKEDLTRLESGAPFHELAVFAPYLIADPKSLVHLLPSNATVVVDGARETGQALSELYEQADEVQRGLEESGNLPPGLHSSLLKPEMVLHALELVSVVELMSGSPESAGDLDWSGLFLPAKLYGGRVRSFVHDVTEHPHRTRVITSYQSERVVEMFAEEGVPVSSLASLDSSPESGLTVLPVSLAEGWDLPSLRLSVLTDHELFGRPRIRTVPRRRRPAREAFFAQFSPGDYVVHLEHGVGRFDSVTRMTIDGAEREYAVIQYAGTDRVYVPTEQLERLTRYISVGDAPPHLNKLGGGEWQRARQRAKQAAADIARELIDVYSKRLARVAHAFSPDSPWQHELESSFPYPETTDQLQAVEDVKEDMEAPRPMDRLVCADVGYGKTEVAIRAAFKAVMDGKQVAVLVPTTILAQQHFETFSERFAAFPLRVEALSRFRSPTEQRDILRRTATGEVDVLIGTHRLLQKDVLFKNLGLLVIDEEQRFGVKHKEQLKLMRETIDVLTLTATPIPRTLHMGLVGIREISVIETPPEGRLPIKTYLQPFDDRLLREAVLRELDREGQVYLVHNRVATIEAMAERIRRLVPEARVLVAHGQMDERQLEKIMMSFAHFGADVLICSTIIENGLDIPNVNTIVVNNAHRLGLTQLYQLRGRVGRSATQAYAYLLYPRDIQMSRDAGRRLEAVFEAQDLGAGLNIAMKDLEIRGVGNLLGAEQSGHATAIGFDLYTRMIGDAVERLRGVPVEERTAVSIDLPLTRFLPAEYIGSESERLTLYRRLAAVEQSEELTAIGDEMRDRFGPLPPAVENLVTSIRLKIAAGTARVTAVSLDRDYLTVRGEPSALFDRISLYKKYGTEAKISTTVLRVPRRLLGDRWLDEIEALLEDMCRLRESLSRQAVEA